jgi:hypothetical protein
VPAILFQKKPVLYKQNVTTETMQETTNSNTIMSVMEETTRCNICITDAFERGKLQEEDLGFDDGADSTTLDDEIRSMEFGSNSVHGEELETKEEEYEDFAVIIELEDRCSKDSTGDRHVPASQNSRMKKRIIESQLAGWRERNSQYRPSRRNSTGSFGDVPKHIMKCSNSSIDKESSGSGTHSRTMPELIDYGETRHSFSRRWSYFPKSPTPEHSGRTSSGTDSIMSMVEFSSPETNKPKRRARRPSVGSALKKDECRTPVTTGGWISDIMGLSDTVQTNRFPVSPPLANQIPQSNQKSRRADTDSSRPRKGNESKVEMQMPFQDITEEILKPQSMPSFFARQTSQATVESYESLHSFSMNGRHFPRMNSGVSMASTIDSMERTMDDSLPRPLKRHPRKAKPKRGLHGRRNSTGDNGVFVSSNQASEKRAKNKYPVFGRRASTGSSHINNFNGHVDSTHLVRGSMENDQCLLSPCDMAPTPPRRQVSSQSLTSESGMNANCHRKARTTDAILGHEGLRSGEDKSKSIMSMKKHAPVTFQLKKEISQMVESPPQSSIKLSLNCTGVWKGCNETACTSNASSFRSSTEKPLSQASTNSANKTKNKKSKQATHEKDAIDQSSSLRPKTIMNRLNIFKSKAGGETKAKHKKSRRSSMNGDLSGPNTAFTVDREKQHQRPKILRSRRRASTGTDQGDYFDSAPQDTTTASMYPQQPVHLVNTKRRAARRLSLGMLHGKGQQKCIV